MITDVHIRVATDDDHAGIAAVAREINVMHAEALPGRFRVADDALPFGYVHALIASDDSTVLVAERGVGIVGYAILHLRESPPIPVVAPRRYALLNDLVVNEAERGTGIGRLLVEAAVTWAEARGASGIELDVFAFNEAAIAFYEHLGFTTVKCTMSLPIDSRS